MKIFVSSTYEDLKHHRGAVRDAILRLGHHPVCMEDFGSRPDPWNIAALNAIADCAAVVGIYAHRYGSAPKGRALSITEQEFDRASQLHIPCFCYLVDSTYPWRAPIDDGIQKDKLRQETPLFIATLRLSAFPLFRLKSKTLCPPRLGTPLQPDTSFLSGGPRAVAWT